MNVEQPAYANRIIRKVRAGGSGVLALVFFLVGVACLLAFWPLGLVLMLSAFLVDAKKKDVCTCGRCGNEVAPSSKLCPTCRAELVTPTASQQVGSAFKFVAMTFLKVTLLIIVVVIVVKNYQ
jgi:hypothetical protein